jgi:hypothetical protein
MATLKKTEEKKTRLKKRRDSQQLQDVDTHVGTCISFVKQLGLSVLFLNMIETAMSLKKMQVSVEDITFS